MDGLAQLCFMTDDSPMFEEVGETFVCVHCKFQYFRGSKLERHCFQRMVEKDVEAAGGSVGVCSDNIVVCGAIAEGVMIFLLIMIIILIIGFSAAWSVALRSSSL